MSGPRLLADGAGGARVHMCAKAGREGGGKGTGCSQT